LAGDPLVSLHVRAAIWLAPRKSIPICPRQTRLDGVHRRGNRKVSRRLPVSVFSDSTADIDWCKQNIRAERLHFSEGHTDIQDMAIMSQCDHHIIANSTSVGGPPGSTPNPARASCRPKPGAIRGGIENGHRRFDTAGLGNALTNAFFSTIIPTFNRRELLQRTLQSVIREGNEPQIIVVDDAPPTARSRCSPATDRA